MQSLRKEHAREIQNLQLQEIQSKEQKEIMAAKEHELLCLHNRALRAKESEIQQLRRQLKLKQVMYRKDSQSELLK